MKKHSDEVPDWQDQRNRIIGLGESSLRKSYYPELQQKMAELQRANEDLQAAYEQLSASEEELRQNYEELSAKERELRESEEKYRSLIENSFDGIVIHKDTRVVFLNRTALRLFGAEDPGEFIGRSIFQFIHPDFVQIALHRAGHGLTSLQRPLVEKFLRLNGEAFDVEVVAGPTLWESEIAVQVAFRDITAQKRAEAALQESEQRYRTLVETTDTGFVIIDGDGRVTDANQKYVELSGHRDINDILGRYVRDWIAVYERDRNEGALMQCKEQGVLRNFETDYVDAGGMITPVEINAALVMYANKPRILALCRDISERRKSELALRESEMFYRAIFETTGAASIIIEADTTIVRANEMFAQISGYTVQELEGRHKWTEFVAPEDLSRMKGYHADRRENDRTVPRVYEFRFIGRQGTLKHCINNVGMIPGTSRSISSVVDISDRVLAEQELRIAKAHLEGVYEGSPDLIYVHGADGRILDVNSNVLRVFGRSREEVVSISPQEMSGEGYTPDMAIGYIRAALIEGKADFEWVGRKKNGEEFPLEVRLRRMDTVREDGTTEPRVLAIARDITERKMAEEALDEARKKLGLLNTIIFQDIQSTIFAMSAYLQLAGSSRNEEKIRAYTEKQADLLQRIVGSLQFAKNYQDMGIHPPRWQNVNQVFLYALSHLDSLKISRNINVDGLEVFADPLLEKALFNLIENSLTHGERVTEITLGCEEREGIMVLVYGDNGRGIPPAEKKKIFERGYGKNAGLGLFLVREILSITGMAIEECGVEGTCARFEIRIPKGVWRIPRKEA